MDPLEGVFYTPIINNHTFFGRGVMPKTFHAVSQQKGQVKGTPRLSFHGRKAKSKCQLIVSASL